MVLNEFPLPNYAPEDDSEGGTSEPETTDDIESQLDAFAAEDDDVTESPTSESDEGTKETPTSEVTEPSEEEPTSDAEPVSSDTSKPEKLYAGKYKTPDELEASYMSASAEAAKLARERAELQRQIEELKATKSEEAPPESKELTPAEDTGGWTQEQKDEYNRLFYDESPADAEIYARRVESQLDQTRTESQALETGRKEAEEFNRNLALSRGRELLFQAAKTNGNKQLMDKYSNESYMPSIDEIQANELVYDQFIKEAEYVATMFQQEPIRYGEKVLSPKGRYKPNVFRDAYRALYYDQDLDKTKISTAEDVANNINKQNSSNGARILTPSEHSKADMTIQWTGAEDAFEAAIKAEKMDPDDLEAQLDEL